MIGKIPRQMVVRLGWTTIAFGIVQVLRVVNNVILARLLSPALFGVMQIVIAIRIGLELLSDVGINQNIVASSKGDTPRFYNTAWTIQAIRGLMLGTVAALLSATLAEVFEKPELEPIFPVVALTFVVAGLGSTGPALVQRQRRVERFAMVEVSVAIFSLVAHVSLAMITPTIWALVIGNAVTGAAAMIATYLIYPGIRHRLMLDREVAREILRFGRWIFVSSIIYFLAMNFDRLYFGRQISLEQLGIYGIARALADMLSSFAVQASNLLLFPTIAAMQDHPSEIRRRILGARRTVLLAVAVGLAALVSISDLLVAILYDVRYQGAGPILVLLLLGVWMAILSTTNESVLLGTSRPAYPTASNTAKLLTYVVGVPVAFHLYGFAAAVLVISAGEVVRYVVLWALSRSQHLGFGREDLVLTTIFVAALLGFRKLLSALGLTGDVDTLFRLLEPGFVAL